MPLLRFFLVLALCAAGSLPSSGARPAEIAVPRYVHPGSGQVIYFLLTDRFANGSPANDTGGRVGNREQTGFDPTAIGYYHGGDFAGLTAKLDYIQGLGATAIWITPPFKNKAVQAGSAGYHGYWILDFTAIDPHLGTEPEFAEFVAQAHARHLRVYLDIVVNHTADVIRFRDGSTRYVSLAAAPYRDASGRVFDPRAVAYNGLGDAGNFPALSLSKSFPHVPVIPDAEAHAKQPEWLNDATLYHNRGNSTFQGENSVYGDFGGLDDVFTENPKVVRGFIAVYRRWLRNYGIDGFRIDTVKHVNLEFWEAFAPALQAEARAMGRPDFVSFGEVSGDRPGSSFRSEFSTTGRLDGTVDFGFAAAARDFVSRGGSAEDLARFFALDSWYTWHDRNADCAATFISNHDAGRFAGFLRQDNPRAPSTQLGALVLLGHELLLTARGLPSIYYGDEQGMVGLGEDMGAREDMFASQAAKFRNLTLLGTSRTGADDKFDRNHPFYRLLARLSRLRASEPALQHGAMMVRPSGQPSVFAFSRIDRDQRVELVVALNNSRAQSAAVSLATCQRPGAQFRTVFSGPEGADQSSTMLTADSAGRIGLTIPPLQCVIVRAEQPLNAPVSRPHLQLSGPVPGSTITFVPSTVDGQNLMVRQELRAEVAGGDGLAEVTFVAQRQSRPDQYELIGTADAPPYRVFWRPPADQTPGERWTLTATVDDLRGGRDVAAIEGVRVGPAQAAFGIKGATVPRLTQEPSTAVRIARGSRLALPAAAEGTAPLEFQWLHDGKPVTGADQPTLLQPAASQADAGNYLLLVHNREGTTVSRPVHVSVDAP